MGTRNRDIEKSVKKKKTNKLNINPKKRIESVHYTKQLQILLIDNILADLTRIRCNLFEIMRKSNLSDGKSKDIVYELKMCKVA